jgi:hypothetical protein
MLHGVPLLYIIYLRRINRNTINWDVGRGGGVGGAYGAQKNIIYSTRIRCAHCAV